MRMSLDLSEKPQLVEKVYCEVLNYHVQRPPPREKSVLSPLAAAQACAVRKNKTQKGIEKGEEEELGAPATALL